MENITVTKTLERENLHNNMRARSHKNLFNRLHVLFTTARKSTAPRRRRRISPLLGSRRDYLARKEAARTLVTAKLTRQNALYGFSYGRIAIRNQRTRWGSCSRKGNLNFHYRILDLPDEIADYIIVHELCHLKALNHGQDFWDLVERTIPNHKEKRRQLRNIEKELSLRAKPTKSVTP
jgi:predicted metal-dependent hydrolase